MFAHFTGKIAGLATSARVIDLVDIAFSSSGTTLGYSGNTLSGTLTVNDGTHLATLALIGNYTAASFPLAADGNGGTFVTDPPVDSSLNSSRVSSRAVSSQSHRR